MNTGQTQAGPLWTEGGAEDAELRRGKRKTQATTCGHLAGIAGVSGPIAAARNPVSLTGWAGASQGARGARNEEQ
jgi:hypothetical protein